MDVTNFILGDGIGDVEFRLALPAMGGVALREFL